jgi:hypothetical protein
MDVTGQAVGHILKGLLLLLDQCILRNVPEEGRSHLHRGGNLKLRTEIEFKYTERRCLFSDIDLTVRVRSESII